MELPGHPLRTGQCNIILYCAPSCLPAPVPTEGGAGRDPVHPAFGGTGHVPVKSPLISLF